MNFPGWKLIGEFDSGVGSWLLVNGSEAMLLEVPEGMSLTDVRRALGSKKLRFATASHSHEDHLDAGLWKTLQRKFPETSFIHPGIVNNEELIYICGEPCWLIKAPKHSVDDVVVVFRGVAMTGDVELGMLASVNNEVHARMKQRSMAWLAGFEGRTGYRVHTIVSAHLNDVRTGVNWAELFEV